MGLASSGIMACSAPTTENTVPISQGWTHYDYTDIYYDGGYEEELDSEEIEAEKERKLQLQALKNEIQ